MIKIRTDQIVKIWFSKAGNHPLGHHINVCRLREHRKRFPKDVIHLISNIDDFEAKDAKLLRSLCEELNINLINLNSIEDKIRSSKLKDEKVQLALLEIAKLEIASQNGSLAAASDIVRILSPIAELGIYCDLDDVKEKAKLELETEFGLFVDAKFAFNTDTGVITYTDGCNTPLACNELGNPVLSYYRELILSNYTKMHRMRAFCQRMQENHFLEKDVVTSVWENIKPAITQNFINKKDCFYPLMIKDELKKILKPENYQVILKMLVIFVSGPNCMGEALNKFLNTDFKEYCAIGKFDTSKKARLIGSLSIMDVFESTHQNDTAWVSTEDDTEKNYEKYYKEPAARIIGKAVLRCYRLTHPEKNNDKKSVQQERVTSPVRKADFG